MPNTKVKQTSQQTGTLVWAESAATRFRWTISGEDTGRLQTQPTSTEKSFSCGRLEGQH